MSLNNKQGFFANLKSDLPAGIVVFLVAVPLCLGIALASGAPLFSGIIAGIVGGIIVSLVSGSSLGVSGPAAGLTVIVLSSIEELGSFELFLAAVFVAGLIQIILGIARAGVIAYYFPSTVIKGMLSAIGIIIILKQIPHAFGYDEDPEGDLAFAQQDGHNTFSEFIYMLDSISPGAIIITAVSLTILILWERPFFKKLAISKVVQGPLLVVIAGILLNLFFANWEDLVLTSEHMVSIPVADSFMSFIGQFTTPDFSAFTDPKLYTVAFTIAIVASLETLLCVEATDKLDPQKRITPTNRELIAQGAGNMVSGLIGGLPVTQVIVRSSANIQSGGVSRASAFSHGVLMLIAVMFIPGILNMIPYASLAAILLVVGYKLSKPSLFKEMYAMGRMQFLPFVITIVAIVFTDLLIGIGIGMVVSIFEILWKNFKTPYEKRPYVEGTPINIVLSEQVSFLNKASILRTLKEIPDGGSVLLDLTKTQSMHPDIVEILADFEQHAKVSDISIEWKGVKGHQVLDKLIDI
ncbi:MAG: SulP family inorganic anion transporter [Cyclobacteriaceae bacterium]